MNTTFTRKITATLAGAATTVGVFASVALTAPALAAAAPTAAATCTTAMAPSRASAGSPNPLTPAAQVAAVEMASPARSSAVSCLSQ